MCVCVYCDLSRLADNNTLVSVKYGIVATGYYSTIMRDLTKNCVMPHYHSHFTWHHDALQTA